MKITITKNSRRNNKYTLNGEKIIKDVLRFRTKTQAIKHAKLMYPDYEIEDKT